MSARGYAWLVLALCAGFVVPVAALNVALSASNFRADKNRLASEWQQATRGITYAPPITHNRPFKTLRLNDRIGEINTVVFGSSTTMGITADAFPEPLIAYNFAQSANSLRSVIGEAEYIAEHWGSRVKLLVIPLDWSLGLVFERGAPFSVELTREAAEREALATRPVLTAQLRDALSLRRVKILMRIARDVIRAPHAGAALRQLILEPAGPEYRCTDGTRARDFDTVYRGRCNGFRHDGSATFADQKRLDAGAEAMTLAAAVSGGGQYAAALRSGRGELNPVLLERLARLARRLEGTGGHLLLLLPPLMPGMEEALSRTDHSAELLLATRRALEAWGQRERLALLDAGRSERYGCTVDEFIDPHHALPACYRRVFAHAFRDRQGFP
jgi:hypothetical protein